MVRYVPVTAALLQAHPDLWTEMRWLWRGDRSRRSETSQIHQLRYWRDLGQCGLWIAWDDDPPRELNWQKPLHVAGVILTFPVQGTLVVQFLAGTRLRSWIPQAIASLEAEAAAQGCRQLEVHIRTKWLQELPVVWKQSSLIHLHRDRGELLSPLYAESKAS